MKNDFIESLVRERRRVFWTPDRLLSATVVVALSLTTVISQLFFANESVPSAALLSQPIFILKMAFVLAIVVAALAIVRDLAVPGRKTSLRLLMAVAPFLIIAIVSIKELLTDHEMSYAHHAVHESVMTCLWQIIVLALPSFAALVVVARSLAPVNLVQTGLYVGLLSGAIGAFGYAFHCHEDFVSITAISYSLAIIPMALLGSLLGPRVLRWS